MQDYVTVTGMIIKTIPVGEFDRHICLLTKERGKITAYAKGARKQNSRLVAATNPFSFGEFKLYVGRSSYNVMEANISNYFEGLREDFMGAYYGMYFLEVMDYYTRENNDETFMLKLLYQSMRAISIKSIPNQLVRYIFEMKAMILNGEFPGVPEELYLLESTRYTINFIMCSPVEKLYTFNVTEEVLNQLKHVGDNYRKKYIDKKFLSLEIIESLC
ncbi:MAG TPA: DNA repair protein RecO [Lachnospiraceae bacterium]|nr:DNA repair protein RecO [Lachnospiraceae bacterium]